MVTTTQIDNTATDSLFKILDLEGKNSIEPIRFLNQLAGMGILNDDPRIQELFKSFNFQEQSKKRDTIEKSEFNEILRQNALVKKSLSKNLVIPDFERFCHQVEAIFMETQKNKNGKVADYIP